MSYGNQVLQDKGGESKQYKHHAGLSRQEDTVFCISGSSKVWIKDKFSSFTYLSQYNNIFLFKIRIPTLITFSKSIIDYIIMPIRIKAMIGI